MSAHVQPTDCLRGGPTKDTCSCYHCTLAVCSVCTAYEGALTTDCPGSPVHFDKQEEVYKTALDYTDEKGWHQSDSTMKARAPNFVADTERERMRERDRRVRKLADATTKLREVVLELDALGCSQLAADGRRFGADIAVEIANVIKASKAKHWPDCAVSHGGKDCDMGPECGSEQPAC